MAAPRRSAVSKFGCLYRVRLVRRVSPVVFASGPGKLCAGHSLRRHLPPVGQHRRNRPAPVIALPRARHARTSETVVRTKHTHAEYRRRDGSPAVVWWSPVRLGFGTIALNALSALVKVRFRRESENTVNVQFTENGLASPSGDQTRLALSSWYLHAFDSRTGSFWNNSNFERRFEIGVWLLSKTRFEIYVDLTIRRQIGIYSVQRSKLSIC